MSGGKSMLKWSGGQQLETDLKTLKELEQVVTKILVSKNTDGKNTPAVISAKKTKSLQSFL